MSVALSWGFGIVATIVVTDVAQNVARRWHADLTWRAGERAQARQDRKRKATFVLTVDTQQHHIKFNDGSAPAWCVSTHYSTVDPTVVARRQRAAAETRPLRTVTRTTPLLAVVTDEEMRRTHA